PPDGAILDYYLGPASSGPVTLEILDTTGALVRRYASSDPEDPIDPNLAIPRPPPLWGPPAASPARRPRHAPLPVGYAPYPARRSRRTRRRRQLFLRRRGP